VQTIWKQSHEKEKSSREKIKRKGRQTSWEEGEGEGESVPRRGSNLSNLLDSKLIYLNAV